MADDTTPVDAVAAGHMSAARISVDDAAEDPVLAEVITAVAQAEVARATARAHPAYGPIIRIPVLGGDDELYLQHPTQGRVKILRDFYAEAAR